MQSRHKLLIVFFVTLSTLTVLSERALSQTSTSGNSVDVALEFQLYPTGAIPGIRAEWNFDDKSAIGLRAGYNVVRHGDAGVHSDERGGGPGFSLGYKRYFTEGHQKGFLGIRSDLWFNDIDWKDSIGTAQQATGNTDVVVLQPTLEGGYTWTGKNQKWLFSPFLAAGYEVNIVTNGEPTGEGLILLGGVLLGYRF